jgi:predicted DNA-binding protein YlxM (UPF0122 family)
MLAQSLTESEIADQLNVNQSTISMDIKVLKKLSQQFVYDCLEVFEHTTIRTEASST